jgi:hypothetical protein
MQLRNLSIVLGIVALGLGAAADAQAAGGSDIASAPQVTPGAENFGDTNTGHIYGDCPADYWNLPLVAGDRAIVDWQSAVDSRNYDYARTLSIYPEGTTDYSINNVSPGAEFNIGSNHRAESVFAAGSTGNYPLVFFRDDYCGATGGPYSFTVTVRHSLSVYLGSVKNLSDRSGVLTVGVHRFDGEPITDGNVRVALRGSWSGHKTSDLATGTPADGKATLSVHLPKSARKKTVSIRAVAAGSGYLTARSGLRTVKVGRK